MQADIHVGRLAPTRTSAEFFPLMVGTVILGGGANSRMFQNIREKEGFAYDAHSEYGTKRDAAQVVAVTQVCSRAESFPSLLAARAMRCSEMVRPPTVR